MPQSTPDLEVPKSKFKKPPPGSPSADDRFVKVGVRIPEELQTLAKIEWACNGGDRYITRCQEMVADEFDRLSDVADEHAERFHNGLLTPLDDVPVDIRTRCYDSEPKQVTLTLSLDRYKTAEKLSFRHGPAVSIPKVIEPLLCKALEERREIAVQALELALENFGGFRSAPSSYLVPVASPSDDEALKPVASSVDGT